MTHHQPKRPNPKQALSKRGAKTGVLKKLTQILAVSRPISWVNTAFPFIAAYLLSGGELNGLFWAATVYFLLPYNLLVYGINDIYDYESDLKNPRKGSLEGAVVAPESRQYLWVAIIITNLASLAWLVSLVSQADWWVLAIIIFCAISYSVKGLRFKEIPLLDSINSACHFVLPAIFGFVVSPSGQIAWLPIAAFGLWGIASHALGAIQDIVPDRAGNVRSIATQWGVRPTTRLAFFCYLMSAGLTVFVAWPESILAALLISIYAFNAAMFLKYSSDAQSKHFRRAWTNFMWLNGVIGFWLTQLIIFVADPFNLGPTRLDYILTFCTLFSIAQIILIAHNFIVFRRPKTQRLDEWPRLSIMIHAYNQAENISSTLLAAVGQNYPDFEVLFTDLGSEDNTSKIAQNFTDKRLRILSIDPLEKGWGVNAWAADQLLGYATGQYAVLISADTVLLPNTLAQIASLLEQEKLDVLSLLSADQNKSIAQKMILSHNQYLMLAAYPSGYLQENAPERSTAHGSIIAFDTAKIRDLKGFRDVKASPLEDQELFHQARKKGLQARLFRASDLATSQNHLGLRAILNDDIQRFYPALRFHFPLVIFLTLGGTFVFSAPLIILIYCFLSGTQIDIFSIAIAFGANILTRILIAVEAKQDIPAQLLAPLTNILIMLLLVVSIAEYELRKPRWKNRTGIV